MLPSRRSSEMSDKKVTLSKWAHFPISKVLRRNLKDQGLTEPLPIQIRTLKATLLFDKNVFGAARTGSGKTLAYAIPLVERSLRNSNQPCSILKLSVQKAKRSKDDFIFEEDGENIDLDEMVVDYDEIDGSESGNDSSSLEPEQTTNSECKVTCPEAIVLVPTRELAFQVKSEIDRICSNTNLRTCCLVGGLSQEKQLRNLQKLLPSIVIATPGRLYDIMQSAKVPHLDIHSVASIRTLVIDEADRMIQKGHFEELIKILDIIKAHKDLRCPEFALRVYLFSATLTFLHELPERFKIKNNGKYSGKKKNKKESAVDPNGHSKKIKIKQMLDLLGLDRSETRIIDLNDEKSYGRPSSEQLLEYKISCLTQEKDLYLYYFLTENSGKRVLVFCNSKDCLRRLANVLKFLNIEALTLHADMDQKKRLSSLEKFRQLPNCVMIATDVAARGLDIKDLDNVVHYQVPKTCESYIHRSGRTARLSKTGCSLTLCEPKEVHFYKRLCNNINNGHDIQDYDINPRLKKLLTARVELAQLCDKIDHQLRESKTERNWFTKAAKECDIELDEDELRRLSGRGKTAQENDQETGAKRRQLSQLKKRLSILLKRPLVSRESHIRDSLSALDKVKGSV